MRRSAPALVGPTMFLLLGACAVTQVGDVMHPSISGSLDIRAADGSQTRWTPDRCVSGDLAYFAGFDFLSSRDSGHLRAALDPIDGPSAATLDAGRWRPGTRHPYPAPFRLRHARPRCATDRLAHQRRARIRRPCQLVLHCAGRHACRRADRRRPLPLIRGAAMSASANRELIERFYRAFQQRDAATMAACYHADATFRDPVFELQGAHVGAMWTHGCASAAPSCAWISRASLPMIRAAAQTGRPGTRFRQPAVPCTTSSTRIFALPTA